jgi:hypothetical protein
MKLVWICRKQVGGRGGGPCNLETQRNPADAKKGRCPFLPPKDSQDAMLDYRDQILVSVTITRRPRYDLF